MDPISELLTRGVANIIPGKSELEKILRSGKKLNVYCGFDVTAPHLHIGNGVPLRKLQQFVNLGHQVTFLIGDFTTLVGDTSDKDSERPVISETDIDKNWQNYAAQAGKILDLTKVAVRRNSEWLDQLSVRELIKFSRRYSLNDFISRELIKHRLSAGTSVNLAEVLYPVLQGYDSYFMDTDIQVGATDQTFNMQAGRILQKQLRHKESFVMSFEFLMGTDGRKMSKSWGNAIWLDDSPNDIFGKVMSIKDELIVPYYLLATNLSPPRISNPMIAKKQLAHQIVADLYGSAAANEAEKHFETTVQHRELPKDIPSVSISNLKSLSIVDVLVETHLAVSKSAARRLIEQDGVKVNGEKISNFEFQISNSSTISVGSTKFVRIVQ
jgi:tyrosyl-tRNA synthetase